MSGLRIEPRIKPAHRRDEIACGAPAETHGRVAVYLEYSQNVAVDEARVDGDDLLNRIDEPQHIEAEVEHERQARNARAGQAEDRHLSRRDLDNHSEIEA